MKHDAVIYDRANSAFAELKTGVVNWDKVLEGVNWFHFSAICPAVSSSAVELCEEALIAASERNITISIDLNYRSKLWQYGVQPVAVMLQLVKHCNLIMGNIWAAEKLLGIPVHHELLDADTKEAYLTEALRISKELTKQYPNCKAIANTFRFDNADGLTYYTTLYQNGEMHTSSEYASDKIIDKVGSGDCFMAGLIYGYHKQLPAEDCLNFATAAAFDKLFIKGDATTSTVAQISKVIKHDGQAAY